MTIIEKETLSAVRSATHKYNRNEPNWDQRRYEIAKDVLSAIITSSTTPSIDEDCQDALNYADALINLLKGGEQ